MVAAPVASNSRPTPLPPVSSITEKNTATCDKSVLLYRIDLASYREKSIRYFATYNGTSNKGHEQEGEKTSE